MIFSKINSFFHHETEGGFKVVGRPLSDGTAMVFYHESVLPSQARSSCRRASDTDLRKA